jgi:hypothetical protein
MGNWIFQVGSFKNLAGNIAGAAIEAETKRREKGEIILVVVVRECLSFYRHVLGAKANAALYLQRRGPCAKAEFY